MNTVWHDLECGRYEEDLELWRALAARYPGPVLDVGAGTGRVTLVLAREGHPVTAIDSDGELLAQLGRRADGLPVETIVADARDFDLGRRFNLCVMPMQTVQLLGGPDGRISFLNTARRHLNPGGRLAVAVAEELEEFEVGPGVPPPLPDVTELDGTVYASVPLAVRRDGDGFVLERRRETVDPAGEHRAHLDRIHLDRVAVAELEGEGRAAGLTPAPALRVPPTADYVGSVVVMFDA